MAYSAFFKATFILSGCRIALGLESAIVVGVGFVGFAKKKASKLPHKG
jgi:hypothetical protein